MRVLTFAPVAHGGPSAIDEPETWRSQWVATIAVATSAPRLMIELALGTFGGGALVVHAGLKVLDAGLAFYLLVSLWRLLNRRLASQPADSLLAWWLGVGAFCSALNVLLPGWSAHPIGFVGLALGIVAVVPADIALGVILLRFKDDPYGCLNAYAFSHIATGVCIAASTIF